MMPQTLALGFSDIGGGEIVLVGMIALLLFGRDLPTYIRKFGRTYAQVKKAFTDASSEFQREIDNAADEVKTIAKDVEKDIPSQLTSVESNGSGSYANSGTPSDTARVPAEPPTEVPQTGKAQPSVSQAAALDALQRNIPAPTKIPPPVV